MADGRQLDFVSMAKEQLTQYIKEDLIDDLVKNELIDYENKIRPIIESEIEKVTLKGISNFRDMLEMRDEYRVYMKWDENDKILR